MSSDFLYKVSRGKDSGVLQDLSKIAGTPSPPAADLDESSLQANSKSSLVRITSSKIV